MTTSNPMTRTHLSLAPGTLPPQQELIPAAPAVDVVIPVHDEQATLEPSVLRVYADLRCVLPYTFRMTIGDNASTET